MAVSCTIDYAQPREPCPFLPPEGKDPEEDRLSMSTGDTLCRPGGDGRMGWCQGRGPSMGQAGK